jgi:hypothetical protein
MQNFTKRQDLDFILVIVTGIVFLGLTIYMAFENPHVTVKYDCSIAEIHPDYPITVKETCRKLRATNN